MKKKKANSNSPAEETLKNPFLGKREYLLIPLLFTLFTLVRVPYLNSDNYILDGDEAVVGIMVKHFSEGREVPFFFYGQEYGFCFIEVLAATPFYWIIGPKDIALNLGMLSLFTLGIFFLYRIALSFSKNFTFSILLSVFMGVFPVWIVWSTKARGGYESAFFLLMLTLWLILVKWKENKSNISSGLIIGLLLGLIWLAQPLWIPGLLPFVVYFFVKDKKYVPFGISIGFACATAWSIKHFLTVSDWYKPLKSFGKIKVENIGSLVDWLYHTFTGWFYLDQLLQEPTYTNFTKVDLPPTIMLLSGISVMLFFALAIYGIMQYKKDKLKMMVGLSLVFSLGVSGVMLTENPRYLLPAAFYFFIAMAIILPQFVAQKSKLVNLSLGALVFLGCIGSFGFTEYGFQPLAGKANQRAEIRKLVHFLKEKNDTYAVSSAHLLHWQLMFYSEEDIIVRYNSPEGRYPAYPQQIDAYLEQGGTIPMIGFYGIARDALLGNPKLDEAQRVGKLYYYLPGFDKSFLEQLEYEF